MILCNKYNVQYIGETKRHLGDRFVSTDTHTTTHWSTHCRFRSLHPSCPFYVQHRTRSRTHQLCHPQGKRSISDLQGQDHWTFLVKHAWGNLVYLCFMYLLWYTFHFFLFLSTNHATYFLKYLKFCNRFIYIYLIYSASVFPSRGLVLFNRNIGHYIYSF